MSQPSAPKDRTYCMLIPHPTTSRILLVESDSGWEMPQLRTTEPNIFAGGLLAGWVKDQWGLIVTQLRIVQAHIDPADKRWDWAMIALENHSPAGLLPPGTHWVDPADLGTRPLADPQPTRALDAWLAERESGEPPARSPWARPGWWAAITAWVGAVLAARGQRLVEPLEQRKVWGISCLLRGETTDGAVYVKACTTLPLFTNEAAMAAELAARYPALIPTPLAVDRERRWMLLADFGGDLLRAAPRAAWDTTVDAYAAIQKDSVTQVESLLAAGCLDRRLDRLVAAIPTLLDGVQTYSSLSAEQLAAFAALLPQLESACTELAGAGIPPTLVHGDLHDGNIAIVAGQPLFFDWSDACIAHPFFDLPTLIYTDYFDAHPAEWEIVRDRYLSHWIEYAPLPELRRIADLATQLGSLHQIVSYVGIVSNLEPAAQWENAGGIDYFMQQLLNRDPPVHL